MSVDFFFDDILVLSSPIIIPGIFFVAATI